MNLASTPTPDDRDATGPDDSQEPLDRLAEEYLGRLRGGDRPRVEEYIDRFPERAEEIRELFSALALVEDLKPRPDEDVGRPARSIFLPGGLPFERLGDYRVLREVGRGGMGIVYEAEQESLGRRVALKVLAPWSRPGPDQVLRFQRESRSAAQLHHTNIVPVFGVGEHDGLHYYAMQYIRGIGLDQVLEEVRKLREPVQQGEGLPAPRPGSAATEVAQSLITGIFEVGRALDGERPRVQAPGGGPGSSRPVEEAGPLSSIPPLRPELSSATEATGPYARSVARLGVQAAEALEYAHGQGMLHRDIKPSNLLLDGHGIVWVTDFGLAKAIDDDDLTRTGDIVGTLRYMAPERFQGRCDARSDVHSLGLTLYEMLALRPAFEASDRNHLIHQITQSGPPRLRRLNAEVPRDLETIIHKAIEADASDRYPTAGLLAEDLRRWLGHEPIRARPSRPGERLLKWSRRNPTLAVLCLVSALAVAAALVISMIGYVQVERGLRRERRTSYFQRIALAERAWAGNDVGRAEMFLDGCRPELRGWEWHYLKRLCRAQLLTLGGPLGLEANAVAFSPDGARVAAAGGGGRVRIWDAGTGEVVRELAGHPGGVYGVAFSPDGARLASAGHDGDVQVWEVATGRALLAAPPHHASPALDVAFSPDGARLASCAGTFWETVGRAEGPGEVTIWDATDGHLLLALRGHRGSVHGVAFDPDGTRLASAGGDGTVKVWDAATGAIVRDLEGHSDVVMGVAYSPDGLRLASAGLDGTLRTWDAATGAPLLVLREPDDRLFAVAFSSDGCQLAAAGRNWVVTLWDAETGEKKSSFRGHSREVTGVAFDPADERRLASAGYGDVVKVWDLSRGQEALTLRGPVEAVLTIAFGPDGRRLAAADRGGAVRAWDVATGREAPVLEGDRDSDGDGEAPIPVAFSPDGRSLARGRGSGEVILRDVATGRERGRLAGQGRAGRVSALAFSSDGRRLAAGGRDGSIRVWDLSDTGGRPTLAAEAMAITGLAFSPDGRYLASSTGESSAIESPGRVTIREARTARVLRALLGHRGGVSDLSFSPDGRSLATASWDRTVGVWDVATGTQARSFGGRGLIAWAVAYSPDGRRLVAADNIGRMTLWDTESGLEVLTIRGHMDRIYDLAFSADGRLLASASRDMTAKIWDATPLNTDEAGR